MSYQFTNKNIHVQRKIKPYVSLDDPWTIGQLMVLENGTPVSSMRVVLIKTRKLHAKLVLGKLIRP